MQVRIRPGSVTIINYDGLKIGFLRIYGTAFLSDKFGQRNLLAQLHRHFKIEPHLAEKMSSTTISILDNKLQL